MTLKAPFYQDQYATIYHGRAEDVLPLLPPADLVLTDPPYGIGEGKRSRVMSRGKIAKPRDYGENEWDNEAPPAWMFGLLQAKGAKQIVWGGNYFPLPPSSCWLVWDKDNGSNDFADCELAWTNLQTAVRMFKWRWNGMLQENMSNKDVRVHPTQKPLALMLWCLQEHAPEAKTIIDPYMGSGTVLRAAKDLQRVSIGIEADIRYCEAAKTRLQQEILPLANAAA